MIDWPFLVTLVSLCGFGAALRNWRMAGTAGLLLANWCIATGYVYRTGDTYPWPVFGAVDYVAGICILRMLPAPVTLWQACVGLIYAGMLICHGAYGWSVLRNGEASRWADYYGYWFLYYAVTAQAIVVACWGLSDLAGRLGIALRGTSSRQPIARRS